MRKTGVAIVALTAWLAGHANAQETRVAPEGHVPPPATIAEAAWLVGDWYGVGIGGAEATEFWAPPSGGTMVGVFVQEKPDGSIRFTEHMYIAEEKGSLVLKLKHFDPDLTAWEEKAEMVRFPLIAIEPCAAWFSGLTYRCDGEDGLIVAVRTESEGDAPEELVLRYTRCDATGRAVCSDPVSTLDMNENYAARLARSDARRAEYLAAAMSREQGRADLLAAMRESEKAFEIYRDSECGAVLTDWLEGGGTLRTIFVLGCRIDLSDKRTQTIWRNWLTFMVEGEPPILPEPAPTP